MWAPATLRRTRRAARRCSPVSERLALAEALTEQSLTPPARPAAAAGEGGQGVRRGEGEPGQGRGARRRRGGQGQGARTRAVGEPPPCRCTCRGCGGDGSLTSAACRRPRTAEQVRETEAKASAEADKPVATYKVEVLDSASRKARGGRSSRPLAGAGGPSWVAAMMRALPSRCPP